MWRHPAAKIVFIINNNIIIRFFLQGPLSDYLAFLERMNVKNIVTVTSFQLAKYKLGGLDTQHL